MKRYTHAWIALKAVDRLGGYVDEAGNDLRSSLDYLHELLDQRRSFVVEGAWVPDNVIRDTRYGHTWKYRPAFRFQTGADGRTDGLSQVRTDHGTTANLRSLAKPLARKSHAWDKPWQRTPADGELVDRCQAMETMIRNLLRLREEELREIAATVYEYLFRPEDVSEAEPKSLEAGDRRSEAIAFLFDPAKVEAFYESRHDGRLEGSEEQKVRIGRIKRRRNLVDPIVSELRSQLDYYVSRHNAQNLIRKHSPMFPLHTHEDQLALHLFSLSHYIADAHMPLHCDVRRFSTGSNDAHSAIEEVWERWVLPSSVAREVSSEPSQHERGREFVEYIHEGDHYRHPDDGPLAQIETDDDLRRAVWRDRPLPFAGNPSLWDDMVGVAYTSYCLGSRLLVCDDERVALPRAVDGAGEDVQGAHYVHDEVVRYGEPVGVDGDNWLQAVEPLTDDEVEDLLEEDALDGYGPLWDLVCSRTDDERERTFEFASLCLLLDAVDRTAIAWAKVVESRLAAGAATGVVASEDPEDPPEPTEASAEMEGD